MLNKEDSVLTKQVNEATKFLQEQNLNFLSEKVNKMNNSIHEQDLSILADKIIKAEKIIQENKNKTAVMMAKKFIDKTSEPLALSDMLQLDEIIRNKL